MLDLVDFYVQALDTVFKEYKDSYGSKITYNYIKPLWEIIRRISYSKVPKKYIDFNEIYDVTMLDYTSICIDFNCKYDELGIYGSHIKYWYSKCYDKLSKKEDLQFLRLFRTAHEELLNRDLEYFDFESVNGRYDTLKLIKEIIVTGNTYSDGCKAIKSDLDIYFETDKKYKVVLKNNHNCDYDVIDANLYYFKAFDLFVIQNNRYKSNEVVSCLIHKGKILHDDIGIILSETNISFNRLLLLGKDEFIECYL